MRIEFDRYDSEIRLSDTNIPYYLHRVKKWFGKFRKAKPSKPIPGLTFEQINAVTEECWGNAFEEMNNKKSIILDLMLQGK